LKKSGMTPLDGRVRSKFSRPSFSKNKVVLIFLGLGVLPFTLSTYAASVTVGTGNLEFGQGSQQAVACDSTVYAAVSEEWHAAPTQEDSSSGFFA